MERLTAIKVLPVLMVFAALAFGVRVSQLVSEAGAVPSPSELALMEPAAGGTSPATPPPQSQLSTQSAPTGSAPPVIEPPSMGAAAPAKPDMAAAASPDWKGADDLDDQYEDVKIELFNDLSKRRKDLDTREKELAMREALLKAARAELEQKYTELTTIKTDIEALLVKQTEEEDKRIASLVKIYEGMKAKDAARIFNTLDLDVLMQVVTRMSERKSAPILAAMEAEKARTVTIMLAEQNKLPSLPQLGAALP